MKNSSTSFIGVGCGIGRLLISGACTTNKIMKEEKKKEKEEEKKGKMEGVLHGFINVHPYLVI